MPCARRANWTSSRHLRGSLSERQAGGGSCWIRSDWEQRGRDPPEPGFKARRLRRRLQTRGRNGTLFQGRFPPGTRRAQCLPALKGFQKAPSGGPAGRAGSRGCFMALRCSGWSCEQPSSPRAAGTARTAGQRRRAFPPCWHCRGEQVRSCIWPATSHLWWVFRRDRK